MVSKEYTGVLKKVSRHRSTTFLVCIYETKTNVEQLNSLSEKYASL